MIRFRITSDICLLDQSPATRHSTEPVVYRQAAVADRWRVAGGRATMHPRDAVA